MMLAVVHKLLNISLQAAVSSVGIGLVSADIFSKSTGIGSIATSLFNSIMVTNYRLDNCI